MELILHDVWALLAGFIVMTTLVFAFALLLARLAPKFVDRSMRPRPQYVIATLAWSIVAAVAGGYVTAWIAAENPLPKVLMLAIIVLVISAVSALEARGRQPVGPQVLGAVLSAAGVVLGGLIRLRVLGLLG